jgi:hypothetical protein
MKVACAVGYANPRAKDEHDALIGHGVGEAESCHRVRLMIVDDHPYPARQHSVFYRKPMEGYP